MKKILLSVCLLLSQSAFANSNNLTYIDGATAHAELAATFSKFKGIGTTPVRANHRHVHAPCSVSLVSKGESSEVQLTINNVSKSFSLPLGDLEMLKESIAFDGEYAWSQHNYSWSFNEADVQRLSLSEMGTSLVVVIDSAKCALPSN
ncbi:MAG: hypothetical protein ACXVBE_04020 [Bdellovibrionota bacterium]